jgi:hypothetical protein
MSAFKGGGGDVDEEKKVAQVKKARLSNLLSKQPASQMRKARFARLPAQRESIWE